MTRINLIEPVLLLDQHLMAEYRELPRIAGYLQKSLSRYGKLALMQRIPKNYLLGTGHVTFFYDKGAFLQARYHQLVKELQARHFAIHLPDNPEALWEIFASIDWFQEWQASRADALLNISRLREKINQKPDFYRFHGKKLDASGYLNYFSQLANSLPD